MATARKSRTCEQCGNTIRPGQRTARFSRGGKSYTIHASCVAAAKRERDAAKRRKR